MVAGEAKLQSEDCLANVPQEQSQWLMEAARAFMLSIPSPPGGEGGQEV